MKILQIVTNTGAAFTVGEPITPEGSPIEKINYERDGYNGKRQGDFPSYVLFFVDSPNRQIIRESIVDMYIVDPELDKKKKDEAPPELPDAPAGGNNG